MGRRKSEGGKQPRIGRGTVQRPAGGQVRETEKNRVQRIHHYEPMKKKLKTGPAAGQGDPKVRMGAVLRNCKGEMC